MTKKPAIIGLAWALAPVLAIATAAGNPAAAQEWPTRTVTLIVPFAAGGTTDLVARPLAQALGERLGPTVVVDNRAGAGGTIGAGTAAKAPPDELHALPRHHCPAPSRRGFDKNLSL